MIRNRNTFALLSSAVLAFVAGRAGIGPSMSSTAIAQEDPGGPAMVPEIAAMMEAGTPGEHHKVLEMFVGEWNGVFSMRMAPEAPMMEMPSHVKRELVLDGRYMKETVTSEGPFGHFEGIGYLGYNNTDHRYEMVWIDSMSTSIYTETGHYDVEARIMRMSGERRDPASGRIVPSWGEMKLGDADHQTFRGFSIGEDGSMFEAWTGDFTRVKDAG